MPRVTRAALRSHAIMEDEANLAAAIPLPSTPHKERAPLGEITNNVQEEVINVDRVDTDAKSTKKAGTKGRKAKTSKKGKKGSQSKSEENPEVLEDENQSDASSAVEEARVELMKEGNGGETPLCLDLSNTRGLTRAFKKSTKSQCTISYQTHLHLKLCKLLEST